MKSDEILNHYLTFYFDISANYIRVIPCQTYPYFSFKICYFEQSSLHKGMFRGHLLSNYVLYSAKKDNNNINCKKK